jgi:hypothetical protein
VGGYVAYQSNASVKCPECLRLGVTSDGVPSVVVFEES